MRCLQTSCLELLGDMQAVRTYVWPGPGESMCFTGGEDGQVVSWRIPPPPAATGAQSAGTAAAISGKPKKGTKRRKPT